MKIMAADVFGVLFCGGLFVLWLVGMVNWIGFLLQ